MPNLLFVDLRRGGRKKVGRGTKLSLHVCGFEFKVNFSNWPTCSIFADLRRGGRKKVGRRTKLSLHVFGFEMIPILANLLFMDLRRGGEKKSGGGRNFHFIFVVLN